MVWPILISVDVTPRISAAGETAGHISATSAPAAAKLVTKRIVSPPLGLQRVQTANHPQARFDPHSVRQTCHDGRSTPIINQDEIEAGAPHKKTRRHRRVFD